MPELLFATSACRADVVEDPEELERLAARYRRLQCRRAHSPICTAPESSP
jgi:hypothetical protein